jgi:RimJ/RimL family protein N-acetyltransferase
MLTSPVLCGAEVTLRPLLASDLEALAQAAAESRASYTFTPVPDGLAATRAYVNKALAAASAGERMPFVIVRRERIVGTTSFTDLAPWAWPAGSPQQRSDRPDSVEIGNTWLAASAQRTRVNSEAKLLLLSHAFEVWEVHGVCIKTDERNQKSRHAIERIGARFEGIRRAHRAGEDGSVRNSAYYAIVRAEWPEVKLALTARLAR